MGKNLIIKGADFSANAIQTGLPSSYDYKILGIGYAYNEFPERQVGDLFIRDHNGLDIHIIKGDLESEHYADLVNGQVFKITDDLYVTYNNGVLTYAVNNILYPITPTDVELGVGGYVFDRSVPSCTKNTSQTSYRCAALNVKKGDIILMKGTGGQTMRPLIVITSGVALELETISYSTFTVIKGYEVKNDGVAYFSNNQNSDANPVFSVYRLGE